MPQPQADETVVSLDAVERWVRSGAIATRFARYGESRMLVHRIESAGRPLPLGLALRWMTRGPVRIEDVRGHSQTIDGGTLRRWIGQIVTEPLRVPSLLREIEASVDALEREGGARRASLDLSKPPLYFRSDLSFGIRAGGSVGHIAGVVNELEHVAAPPILMTTDDVATVNARVEQHLVAPSEAFWNFKELPSLVLNAALEAATDRVLAGRTPGFVYQRYSLNNFTGVRVARQQRVPLVVEYNGSEIWMVRHWGRRRLKYERLSERIERLNLRAADLVVVVSRAMKDEIVLRGVDESRILVNPNGVDPDRYSPGVSGAAVRETLGLQHATVVGFIGTFGPWHGAEALARAYVKLRASNPAMAARVRLLMIGAGATLEEVKRILAAGGAIDAAIFTGLVPQEDGASYLAACDVLVSPHVPNPDGTPFFGSPTKLFEYMALGKGIVASNLDQIGDVLEDGKTALLTQPGDVDALANAMARLVDDRTLRECLGTEARRVVLERYTWRAHTQRTIDRLRQIAA
jgi:glycosyltransferase involved in cell wall biosynthesis